MRGAVAFDARSSASTPAARGSPSGCTGAVPGDHPRRLHRRLVLSRRLSTGRAQGRRRSAPRSPFDVDGATIVLVDDVLYTGRSVRAAINELFDFGRPARDRAGGAGRPRRARAADRADLCRRAARRRAATCRSCCRSDGRGTLSLATEAQRKRSRRCVIPQLNANGELTHLLTLEGLPRGRDRPHPRHRRRLRVDRRARGEEGAAAARQDRVQPVLRELDAHAHDVRDRGQAAVGRRHQPQHRRFVDHQGRDAARHRRQPGRRCTPTCSSCATRSPARRT